MHDLPPEIAQLAPLIDALPDGAALVEAEAGAGLGFAVLHANDAFRAAPPAARPDLRALVARVAETGEAETLEPEDARFAFAASRPWPGRVLLVLRAPADASSPALAQALAARTASEHRMRTIAELCPVPLAENDRDGNILFVNAAFVRTYGYTQAQIPTLQEWWAAAYPDPAYREHVRRAWVERMDAALATGTPFETMEVTIRCADGADRVALADFVPYGKTADEPFLVSLFDITEVVAARRTQETARRHAECIIDSVGEGLCLYDREGCIQYMNPVGANLLGYEPHRIIGRSVHALFHHSRPDGSPLPAEACVIQNTVRLGKTQFSGADVFWRRDGSSFPVQFVAAPLLEDGETEAAVLTFRDITEETRVLKTLLDNEIKIRKAREIAGFGSYATDLLTGRWESSAVLDAIFGVPEDFDHTIPNWNSVLDPEFQQPALDHYLEVAQGKCDYRMDYRIIRPVDGVKRWVAANGELEFDANGTPTRLIGTIQDITDRKEKEQALAALVHEKEALLKEVHHRVKNNLQVITSLLRLEIARTSQPDAKAVLSEMQGRIRSMAILHQSLYRSGDFGAIDLGDYLRQLATQTHLAQSTRASAMRLRCEVASMFVNIDQAIPCGLLVNELVSNCVKHAFPEGFEGANAITLSLQPAPVPGQWRLEVADTGVGLPPDFGARRAASLGLQLATDLARQLGGTLVVGPNSGGGARFTVDFAPMERPSRAAP
jgi:PAS domain S-box-containing protein